MLSIFILILMLEVQGDNWYDKLPEPVDEEYDMLDLAFGLTDTYERTHYLAQLLRFILRSRLGCQVKMNEVTDNITVKIPSATRNMMVDGHVPKPH